MKVELSPQDYISSTRDEHYLKTSIPLHTKTEEKCELPIILNFYGCSFNFAKNSTAESRNISDNEEYNHHDD